MIAAKRAVMLFNASRGLSLSRLADSTGQMIAIGEDR